MTDFLSREADILGNEFSTSPHGTIGVDDVDFDCAASAFLDIDCRPSFLPFLEFLFWEFILDRCFKLRTLAAMEPALTLANAPLDLQITICLFLHPSDILTLRKTCKALELATRQRTVWMSALHRVCIDNTLFLPSFPIPDMSDLELERAAMAPRRWIELCGAFRKRHSVNFSGEILHPRTSRIIKEMINSLFIVPGGRYLVTAGILLRVWDLGYASTADCKLVASVGRGGNSDFEFCMVQATPDGKGLVILTTYSSEHLSIFEIYPQSEIPVLTQIAHLHWNPSEEVPADLLPETVICRVQHDDRIVFRVVDYRTNYSTFFSVDVDAKRSDRVKTFATKSAIIVFTKKEILICAIPPLLPRPSDHSLDNPTNTHIQPLFKISLDDIVRHNHDIFEWLILSSWYFERCESLYFGIVFSDSKLQRFKIIIKPDLSDASLHVINISEIVSDGLMRSLKLYRVCDGFRICEDNLVYFWNYRRMWGAYTGLTSAPFTSVDPLWDGHVDSLCPTSGRFVYCTDDGDGTFINRLIVVVDLF